MAAVLSHPRHIAGDGRLETQIMQALPGLVFAKTGAEGGFGLALAEEKLGVALKIEDGSSRALGPAIIEVLQQLGLLTPEAREALAPRWRPVIRNHRQQEVGRLCPGFHPGRVGVSNFKSIVAAGFSLRSFLSIITQAKACGYILSLRFRVISYKESR